MFTCLSYNGGRGIIQPRRGRKDPRIGPDVVMVMIPSLLRMLVRKCSYREVHFSDKGIYHLYTGDGKEERGGAIAGPFLGAPMASMALEKLVVLGAERIWIFGWCGSINPSVQIGGIVIPDSALSEEGTSMHYPVRSPLVFDEVMSGLLSTFLEKRGLGFKRGRIWTTDAPYRETPEKVIYYKERGVLGVEMELSSLVTVAAYRCVKIAALLVVSDELYELKWRKGFDSPLLKEVSLSASDIFQEILKTNNANL